MDALTMTARRAAVLRAVARGEVHHHRVWGHDPDYDVWRREEGRKTVTGVCRELRDAGLVKLGVPDVPSMYARRRWEPTDAGRRWLADNPEV